jgi:hypothetical protein
MRVLVRLLPLHPFVQNDGPVSIRRAFSVDDWIHHLNRAGIESNSTRIFKYRPARLCVSRVK